MLSKQQKTTISATKMHRKPRYVRVPVQMSNRVRDLKTDVNFSQIAARFDTSIDQLRDMAAKEPVYHIRFDQTTNQWYSLYCKLCDAFRSLNNSRVIRRMRISGFRMLNVSTHLNGHKIVSDTYVAGLDCASILLDSIVRFMMPAGRLTVLIEWPFVSDSLAGIVILFVQRMCRCLGCGLFRRWAVDRIAWLRLRTYIYILGAEAMDDRTNK